jgi:MacB-like periplasmic core domain
VVCLSVGIGANTTVFTIINTLLLHPLPAEDRSRLVVLYDAPPSNGREQQWGQPALSYANLQDYMQRQECFHSVAAFTWPQVLTLAGRQGPERMFGELVSQRYFDTLGLNPALGRFFLPSEDSQPGSAPVRY